MIERHLARRIELQGLDSTEELRLSIVSIDSLGAGECRLLSVEAFEGESEGVTYHDRDLRLVQLTPTLWQLSEVRI